VTTTPAGYPATLDMTCRTEVPRDQAILHIVVLFVLWILGGIINFLANIVAPILIAIRVAQKGPEKYMEEDSAEFSRYGSMLIALYAYAAFLTDEFPDKAPGSTVDVKFEPTGAPGGNPPWLGALLRPIWLIPHGLVLGLFGIAFIVIIPWTAIGALINEQYPRRVFNFVLEYLRWETRMTAYLFSLAQTYPPFPIDTLLNALFGGEPQTEGPGGDA
jgi:hypothetical protein